MATRSMRPTGVLPPTFGPLVQQGRHAEDVVVADVRHGRLDHALAVLQTAVPLEGVPLGAREEVQVLAVRHQDNLESKQQQLSNTTYGRCS